MWELKFTSHGIWCTSSVVHIWMHTPLYVIILMGLGWENKLEYFYVLMEGPFKVSRLCQVAHKKYALNFKTVACGSLLKLEWAFVDVSPMAFFRKCLHLLELFILKQYVSELSLYNNCKLKQRRKGSSDVRLVTRVQADALTL